MDNEGITKKLFFPIKAETSVSMAGGGEGFTVVLTSFTNHGELMATQYQQIWCGVKFFSNHSVALKL